MSERIYPEGHDFGDDTFYLCDYDTVATGLLPTTLPTNVRRVRQIGGPSNNLGLDLTPEKVNSSGFGVRVRYRGTDVDGSVTFRGVRIRVWYLPPVGIDAPNVNSNVVRGLHPAWTSAAILPSGRMVVAGTKGRIRYSDDRGQTWTDVTPAGAGSRSINRLEKVGSGVVAVGDVGLLLASDDASSWNRVSLENNHDLISVSASAKNREYLLFSPTGEIYRNQNHALNSPFDIDRVEFLPLQASLGEAAT